MTGKYGCLLAALVVSASPLNLVALDRYISSKELRGDHVQQPISKLELEVCVSRCEVKITNRTNQGSGQRLEARINSLGGLRKKFTLPAENNTEIIDLTAFTGSGARYVPDTMSVQVLWVGREDLGWFKFEIDN